VGGYSVMLTEIAEFVAFYNETQCLHTKKETKKMTKQFSKKWCNM